MRQIRKELAELALESQLVLDEIGRKLLTALQCDARTSFTDLGRLVGLSAPAVAERVRRLEDAGIITGYRAEVNPSRLGLPICAFIRIHTSGGMEARTAELVQTLPEVIECHRVTGSDCFVVKILVSSIPHLEELIDRLSPYGELTTSIVLSSPVTHRMIEPRG
jgi:Lrp/AsnC family transcriptional regulator, leucine-responsive regulatory protein